MIYGMPPPCKLTILGVEGYNRLKSWMKGKNRVEPQETLEND